MTQTRTRTRHTQPISFQSGYCGDEAPQEPEEPEEPAGLRGVDQGEDLKSTHGYQNLEDFEAEMRISVFLRSYTLLLFLKAHVYEEKTKQKQMSFPLLFLRLFCS